MIFSSLVLFVFVSNSNVQLSATISDKTGYFIEFPETRTSRLADLIRGGFHLGELKAGDLSEKLKVAVTVDGLFKIHSQEFNKVAEKAKQRAEELSKSLKTSQSSLPSTQPTSQPTSRPSEANKSEAANSSAPSWDAVAECFHRAAYETYERGKYSAFRDCVDLFPIGSLPKNFSLRPQVDQKELAVFIQDALEKNPLNTAAPYFDSQLSTSSLEFARKLWLMSRKKSDETASIKSFFEEVGWLADFRKNLDRSSAPGVRYLDFCNEIKNLFGSEMAPFFVQNNLTEGDEVLCRSDR